MYIFLFKSSCFFFFQQSFYVNYSFFIFNNIFVLLLKNDNALRFVLNVFFFTKKDDILSHVENKCELFFVDRYAQNNLFKNISIWFLRINSIDIHNFCKSILLFFFFFKRAWYMISFDFANHLSFFTKFSIHRWDLVHAISQKSRDTSGEEMFAREIPSYIYVRISYAE